MDRIVVNRHTIFAILFVPAALALLLAEMQFGTSVEAGLWLLAQSFGLAALLVYLWLIYRKQRGALLTSFYQIFYWFGILASAVAISAGTFMIEIERWGTANGTFWLAVIFFMVGMEMTVMGYRWAAKPIPLLSLARLSPFFPKLGIFVAVSITLGLSAYILVRYQGPIIAGIDRVRFWSEFPRPLSSVPTLVTQTFFFAAYYYLWRLRNRRRRFLAMAVVGGFLLSGYFVLGQKFSLYIIFLNTWLFLMAGLLPQFRFRFRHVLLAAFGAGTLVIIVAFAYLDQGRGIGFILTRVALQAQVLWSAVDDRSAFHLLPQSPACYWGCGEFRDGMDFISHRYLPTHRYEHYKSIGNVLSGFTPALPLATFGIAVTLMLYLSAMFVLGWLQRKAVNAFSNESMIYGFLLFKIHLGFSVMVATGMISTLPGIAATAALVMLYHLLFAHVFWPQTKRETEKLINSPR